MHHQQAAGNRSRRSTNNTNGVCQVEAKATSAPEFWTCNHIVRWLNNMKIESIELYQYRQHTQVSRDHEVAAAATYTCERTTSAISLDKSTQTEVDNAPMSPLVTREDRLRAVRTATAPAITSILKTSMIPACPVAQPIKRNIT